MYTQPKTLGTIPKRRLLAFTDRSDIRYNLWRYDASLMQPTPYPVVCSYLTSISAYSGAMDITLALLPWFLIMKVHMRLTERIGVAVAMSCGIL